MTTDVETASATTHETLDPKTITACERNTVRIFLSHKNEDSEAARKIKDVLMTHAAGKLEVFTFEEIKAGVAWKTEIHQNAEEANWFVLLFTEPSEDWGWCLYEAGIFRGNMGQYDRLVCLHHPGTEAPNVLDDFQGVVGEDESVKEFLRELYGTRLFPCMDPVNPYLAEKSERLEPLVSKIRDALRPPKPAEKRVFFNEHLNVEISDPENKTKESLLRDAAVSSEDGLERILGLYKTPKSWDELKRKVQEEQQDIRWLMQLEDAIFNLARGRVFPSIQATFRSPSGGWFYRPVIHFVDETSGGPTGSSMILHILFTQEAAGGVTEVPVSHATITSAMNMGSRFRWEILDKFTDIVETKGKGLEHTSKRIKRLRETIDTIESETLSRGLFDVDELTRAFGEETGRKQIGELLQRWKHDRINLDNAISRESLSDINDTLEKLKETNKEIMMACCRQYREFIASW